MAISEVDLRRRWAAGQPCHGLWSLLPGAVTGEVLARTRADYVVVDLQHGAMAEAELPGVAAAIAAAGAVPLVRTRSPAFADVGRPLDLGAGGVIVARSTWAPTASSCPTCATPTTPGRSSPPAGTPRPVGGRSDGSPAVPTSLWWS